MNRESITMRAFKQYSSYNPRYFPLVFLRSLFNKITPFFSLWMSAEIVTALYEGRGKEEMYRLVLITLLGNLLLRVLGAVMNSAAQNEYQTLLSNESNAFNAKTLSLDYDKLENPEIRQLRRKIRENSYINDYGTKFMKHQIEFLIDNCISLFCSLVLLGEMVVRIAAAGFQKTGILLFLGLIMTIVLGFFYRKRRAKYMGEESAKVGEHMLNINRMGQGYSCDAMDSRIYKQQLLVDKFYSSFLKEHLAVFSRYFEYNFRHTIPLDLMLHLSNLCAYLIVGFYCTMGVFPVGSVIKYVGTMGKMTTYIGALLYFGSEMKVNEPFLATYMEYFDIKNDMYQGSLSVEKRSDKKFDIEFKNVTFQYTGTDKPALKNINLNVNVGERLAVVGMNGSGKTTFIKLLCRLYDPTEGEILMNDFNVRKYDYRQYLDLFSVVFQDYKLLSVPLGNNVASAENWDTKKTERLLTEVGFGERYAEMPEKLATSLYKDFDENGVNVSGGEAQKIALARALYKDAPFIILDEPTAALDPIAEAEIYTRFDEIVGDKTAIYISHRLSSCRFCDKIAVFHEGEIVQLGTHEELLADENGKYYELWNAQAQYYTEDVA